MEKRDDINFDYNEEVKKVIKSLLDIINKHKIQY